MKKVLLVPVVALAMSITACTTVNPYTGESEASNATKGAAIGAIVGAIAGVATGDDAKDRRQRALKGAGIGAVAGGGVGVYMDVQEKKLRNKLQATGVSVTRDGDNIILNMPGNITFPSNSDTLREDIKPVLDSVAEVLKEYESTMIQVGGYTDSTGGDDYNMLLSKQRAQSVANVLTGFGIQSVRVVPVGFGETNPIASNDTAAGRAENRRVELTLVPYVED
ncbi:MAG: OmpA family protein [Oleibacter sp.]|nr:OmpA family protein [Thalassolituus sp.]